VARVSKAIAENKTQVIDVDVAAYFDNVRHDLLLAKVAHRVQDAEILHLLKLVLTASGKRGVPQGGVVSRLLANIYLHAVDAMLERAKATTQNGKYTYVEYARYADDLVILVHGHWRNAWLLRAVDRRLREELAKLDLRLNDEKSQIVDLTKGEAFGFLGFTIRRLRSRRGYWWALVIPAVKQRTALLRKLKAEFRRLDSQPVGQVIAVINPVLRGWVNYFRVGNASACFTFVKDWVEKKVRRHLMRARSRGGFGWKRWSRVWLYQTLGLFNDYRVSWRRA
jgi:RNA-directed DNA polymerase